MKKMLKFEHVNYFYQTTDDEIHAIDDLSFDVFEHEFVSIVGPSGCGKTTILSLIAGLLKPSSGRVLLDGKESLNKNDIGYMFQRDMLFDWRSVWKNITIGLEIEHKNVAEKLSFTEELLKKYNLYNFKDKKPSSLSGGMKQRVALLRTLVLDPKLLLLDEPFSALDFQTRVSLCDDVYEIIKGEKKTAILVTHDITEAITMSDRIIVLTERPARVKDIITLDLNGETPLKRREDDRSNEYFQKIWRELNNEEAN